MMQFMQVCVHKFSLSRQHFNVDYSFQMLLKLKRRPGNSPNAKFFLKNNQGQYIVLNVRYSVSLSSNTASLVTKKKIPL